MKFFTAVLSLLAFTSIYGQVSILKDSLDDIVISATRINTNYLSSPISVHQTKLKSFEGRPLFSAQEVLQNSPGVFSSNQYNSAQDLRISIRGFGARSAFGIRGVKLLMDGIPLSTPDGQGQVDNLILNGLKSIEVMNGASSALYGNASGGVISFNTFNDDRGTSDYAKANYGSFGNFQFSFIDKTRVNGWFLDTQVSVQDFQGYREQGRSRNIVYNGRLKKTFNDSSEFSIIFNWLNSPYGEDPGGITIEQAESDPSSARDRNILFDAGEDLTQSTVGIKYFNPIGKSSSVKLTGYYTGRDFNNRLPFENGGQVDLDRNFGGGIAEFKHDFTWGAWTGNLLTGLEIEFQNDLRKRYNNLEGDRGDLSLEQNEIFNNQALFVAAMMENNQFLINAGLRFDNNQIKVKDQYLVDGNQDGAITLPSLSPSLSLSYNLIGYHFLRAAMSYGFETPTLNELSNRPDIQGGFNDDLQAQESYNYELGYRAQPAEKLTVDLTLFSTRSRNELLPYEIQAFPGRTLYRNAGRTQRNGIEALLKINPSPFVKFNVSYAFSNFTFEEYLDLNGKQLPGIPNHQLSAQLRIDYGWIGTLLQHQLVSSLFADNANEFNVPAYNYTSWSVDGSFGQFRPYFGVNNLFNVFYFDNIRINAFGQRFYEPGAPRNFYLGLKFVF